MIKLFVFPAAFGLRQPSPFCLKTEMALKFLDLEYDIETIGDPRKAPKSKLPFIEMNGEKIADSELILERLDRQTDGGLFARMTPAEMARGTAFTRLAEDHLYWLLVASRWLDDDWWPNVVEGFFGALPGVVRAIIAPMARKQVREACYAQGLGRHSLSEQKQLARRDLRAINDTLADSGFIAGPQMTAFDFAVAAQLSSLLDSRPGTWLTSIANELPALSDYAQRVQDATNVYGRQPSA